MCLMSEKLPPGTAMRQAHWTSATFASAIARTITETTGPMTATSPTIPRGTSTETAFRTNVPECIVCAEFAIRLRTTTARSRKEFSSASALSVRTWCVRTSPTTTARWGDIVANFQEPFPASLSQSNVGDLVPVIDKIKDLPSGVVDKWRVHMQPGAVNPNAKLSVVDLTLVVDSVKGLQYPSTSIYRTLHHAFDHSLRLLAAQAQRAMSERAAFVENRLEPAQRRSVR